MAAENNHRRVLHIQPLSKEVEELYRHHGKYHEGDSGLDLFVIEDATIKPGETVFLKMGIKCAAYNENKQNISWMVVPRSSISKTPLRLSNSVGLIDAGYRGEIIACLDNIKSVDYSVKKGDRLLQAIYPDLGPFAFEIVDELNVTSRGESGFGSTTSKEVGKTEADRIEDNSDAAVITSEVASTNAIDEQKKPDFFDSENQGPIEKASESRKRSSGPNLENQDGLIKKARSSDTSTSVEISES